MQQSSIICGILRVPLVNNEIIVYDLPESYSFLKQMIIDVNQLIDDIESGGRDGNRSIANVHTIRELSVSLFCKEPLQPMVMQWIMQIGRTVMQFHRNAVDVRKINVMITRLFRRSYRADKTNDIRRLAINPNIYIPRGAVQRTRIHHGIALTLQDTRTETFIL